MNLGWLCMSWRQPASPINASVSAAIASHFAGVILRRFCFIALMRHLRDLDRIQPHQESPRGNDIEFRIRRLDAEEEPVAAGRTEPRIVEHRVVGLGKSVQSEHAYD